MNLSTNQGGCKKLPPARTMKAPYHAGFRTLVFYLPLLVRAEIPSLKFLPTQRGYRPRSLGKRLEHSQGVEGWSAVASLLVQVSLVSTLIPNTTRRQPETYGMFPHCTSPWATRHALYTTFQGARTCSLRLLCW